MESLDIFKNKHLIFVTSLKEPFNRKSLKFQSAGHLVYLRPCPVAGQLMGLEIPFQPTDPKKNKTKKQNKTKTKTKQKNKKQKIKKQKNKQTKNKQAKKQTNKNWLHSMSIFPSTSMHSLVKAKSLLMFFTYCSAKWEDHTQTQQFESLRLFTIWSKTRTVGTNQVLADWVN